MDVEATTAVRQAEVTAQRVMLDRTQQRFGIWPERLAADTGYGSAENLARSGFDWGSSVPAIGAR